MLLLFAVAICFCSAVGDNTEDSAHLIETEHEVTKPTPRRGPAQMEARGDVGTFDFITKEPEQWEDGGVPALGVQGPSRGGIVGATGMTGVSGPRGATGQTGETGEPGMKGQRGDAGLTGLVYQDSDQCTIGNHTCQQQCFDKRGGYGCGCLSGYILDANGHSCYDLDECTIQNGGCEHVCDNVLGSYSCGCLEGFSISMDGHTCIDVDECCSYKFQLPCASDQTCINTLGAYFCFNLPRAVKRGKHGEIRRSGTAKHLVTKEMILILLVWLSILTLLVLIAALVTWLADDAILRAVKDEFLFITAGRMAEDDPRLMVPERYTLLSTGTRTGRIVLSPENVNQSAGTAITSPDPGDNPVFSPGLGTSTGLRDPRHQHTLAVDKQEEITPRSPKKTRLTPPTPMSLADANEITYDMDMTRESTPVNPPVMQLNKDIHKSSDLSIPSIVIHPPEDTNM